METPLTYAITLFVRLISGLLSLRKKKAEERAPGAPPVRREAEAGWVRGGSLYRYTGRSTTLSIVLPSLYTQQAAEDREPGGITTYMTWADVVSPEFSKTLIEQIKRVRGEAGERQG